jgi:hypothetical protein
MSVDAFFAYARERHATHLRRAAGLPRDQWTSDPILRQYRFCNIFRELDRTTIWFRENVRDRLRNDADVLLATVLFRWFNRIATGEGIFCQTRLDTDPPGATAWDEFLGSGSTAPLGEAVRAHCGAGPYVTGSYIIKTPDGRSKLDGVLWCVEQFMMQERLHFDQCSTQDEVAQYLLDHRGEVSLHDVWSWLREYPYMGDFMAYEVVTDLRHTALLDRAPDIMTWANPGPGAQRGLARLHGRPLKSTISKERACEEMRELLALSQQAWYWPNVEGSQHEMPGDFTDWPSWEMREVEHTLCEFDKYERARLGEGRPRQVLR